MKKEERLEQDIINSKIITRQKIQVEVDKMNKEKEEARQERDRLESENRKLIGTIGNLRTELEKLVGKERISKETTREEKRLKIGKIER